MSDLPPGLAPRLVAFCESLRAEGVGVGTSEMLDAFAALEAVPWTTQADFREALAATVAKSQEDRRVFELVFDRFFFRAAEAEALERGVGEQHRFDAEGAEAIDLEALRRGDPPGDRRRQRRRDARPGAARDRRLRPPRRGLGRDRRRRAADPPGARTPDPPAGGCRRRAADRPRGDRPLRAPPAPRARARGRSSAPSACLRRVRWRSSTAPCPRARPRTWPPSTAPSPS